jgi:hypothetical protein
MIDSGLKSAGTLPGLEAQLGLKTPDNLDAKAIAVINNKRAGESMK